jgi:hypothetical protein
MCERVSNEQQHLKNEQARRPYCRSTAEHWQDQLAKQQLDKKEKKGTCEDRNAKDETQAHWHADFLDGAQACISGRDFWSLDRNRCHFSSLGDTLALFTPFVVTCSQRHN